MIELKVSPEHIKSYRGICRPNHSLYTGMTKYKHQKPNLTQKHHAKCPHANTDYKIGTYPFHPWI